MSKYDVVIIGGGVSGLTCAITLGSGIEKFEFAKGKTVLVIDAGKSHLNAAQLNNVPGVIQGTKGPDELATLKGRAEAYEGVSVASGTVLSVSGEEGSFLVKSEDSKVEASTVVFAPGLASINIEGIGADVVDHYKAPKPNLVMIENKGGVVAPGKYVTGCAAGASTMYASAAGLGAETATDILSSWTDKYVVVHDVNKG